MGIVTGDAVENRDRPGVFGVGLAESEIAERDEIGAQEGEERVVQPQQLEEEKKKGKQRDKQSIT